MLTLQTLIITRNKKKEDIVPLLDFLNIQSDAIVSNQVDCNEDYHIDYKGHDVLIHFVNQVGVSRNRNEVASLCTADIMLFSDDDTPLTNDYPSFILNDFKKNNCDAYLYSHLSKDRQFNNKLFKNKRVLFFSSISSIGGSGLCILRNVFLRFNLSFNEKIGFPNYFYLGEDSIFGKELLNNGVRIRTSSHVLYTIIDNNCNSSYFQGYTERYFVSVGGINYVVYRRYYYLRFIYLSIKWLIKTKESFFFLMMCFKKGKDLIKTII